jgi:hypothetical protein
MRVQIGSLLLIGILMFTSITAFGNDTVSNSSIESHTLSANTSFSLLGTTSNLMEYCTVDLDDPRSNLNVRTWEGRVIGKLRHGTSVWVSDYSGEWAKVSVKRGRRWVSIGWVDSNYLVC